MDWELIFWTVIGIGCLVFFGLCALCADKPSKKDDITILRIGR